MVITGNVRINFQKKFLTLILTRLINKNKLNIFFPEQNGECRDLKIAAEFDERIINYKKKGFRF